MKIEVLFFEGCPSLIPTLKLLYQVLLEEGINSFVEQINVDSEELVRKHMFLGSPSIRINGKDVEIEARDSNEFGQKCRIYINEGIPSGIPSQGIIRKAVHEAKKNHSCCG